jgi:hypothetical protein
VQWSWSETGRDEVNEKIVTSYFVLSLTIHSTMIVVVGDDERFLRLRLSSFCRFLPHREPHGAFARTALFSFFAQSGHGTGTLISYWMLAYEGQFFCEEIAVLGEKMISIPSIHHPSDNTAPPLSIDEAPFDLVSRNSESSPGQSLRFHFRTSRSRTTRVRTVTSTDCLYRCRKQTSYRIGIPGLISFGLSDSRQ